MGDDRRKNVSHRVPGDASEAVEQDKRPSFGASLQRAVSSITGDSRQRLAFQASPQAFLARHSIDVRGVEGRGALDALTQLVQTRGAREADPSGEAHASGVVIAPSDIHGEGVFASAGMDAGQTVCDVGVGDQVSHTASYVNQSSASPNATMVDGPNGLVVSTLRPVQPGEELVANYPLVDGNVKATIPKPRSG